MRSRTPRSPSRSSSRSVAVLAYAELERRVSIPTTHAGGRALGRRAGRGRDGRGAQRRRRRVAGRAVRGREMAAACALEPTGMAAVMGGDPSEVVAWLAEFDLTAANRNGAGQIVAAGPLDALDKIAEDPPEKARVRPLATAGAFHTRFMASALDAYASAADGVTTSEPTAKLLSNADGQPVASAADAMSKLVSQLTRPVRWDLCTATMRQDNVTAIVEFPPAGTLAGIAKRELRGVPTHAVKSPADLDGLAELSRA